MTESEARKNIIDYATMEYENLPVCMGRTLGVAIKALEEIQQYRALGTVEELAQATKYMNLAKQHGTIGEVIDECAEYEAIGTVGGMPDCNGEAD